MKKFIALIATALLAVLCMAFVACAEEGERISLHACDNVYSHGEQTIEITITDDSYTFEESIAVSDVTVGDGLEGKEVTAVTYVDETTISVTLSGTVTAEVGDDGIIGSITVGGGISGNATGTAYLHVFTPQMTTSSVFTIGSSYFATTFALPYGSFVEEYVNTDNVTLTNGTGTLNVRLTDDGQLNISVKDFAATASDTYPVVKIAAEVTTFNKELYVYIGVIALQGSGYDLV